MVFDHFLEVFSVLLVVLDPLGVLPVFMGLTQAMPPQERERIARQACVIAFIVLLAFTVLGDAILDQLSISEPAFRIAGAILLLLTSIDMVVAHHLGFSGPTNDEEQDARQRGNLAIFPLAIPLVAGPGGMVSVIMLTRRVEGQWGPMLWIIVALALVLVITYLVLRFSGVISRFIGAAGANVLTRIFGIILAALAIQFMINAINDLLIVPFFKS